MRSSFGRAATALAVAATTLTLAACGSDGGGSGGGGDEAAIKAAVVKALTTKDPEVKCAEVVTKGFVSTVYGDLATCKKAETPKPDDDPKPDGASISGLKVDGDTASATVNVEGGGSDGATGTISFEKEDGDWKVSDLSAAFLRSQLTTALRKGTFTADDGPLADEKVRSCINDDLQALDDATFRKLAFASIADAAPDPKFVEVVTKCSSGALHADDTSGSSSTASDADVSLLRRQFEKGLRQTAKKDGATDAQLDCIVKKLRTTISDQDIVDEIGRGGKASPHLAGEAAKAIAACG